MTLDQAVLGELRTFSTPSVANGIEAFEVRGRHKGYTNASITCMFPDLGVAVGYAATATIRAAEPGESHDGALWSHVLDVPAPRIVVIEDLDDAKGTGSYWGEVNSTLFGALGAIGVLTDGCVRDLDEMRANGFHAFAASVGVSHAWVHVVDAGVPVTVGGLEVRPGDLLHMDKHGVVSIPIDIAERLPDAIRNVETAEQGFIAMLRSPDFSPERFAGHDSGAPH